MYWLFNLTFVFFQLTDQLASLPYNDQTNQIEYTSVIQTSLNKDEIHISARKWMVNQFQDAKQVIQIDDKKEGLIIGKGILNTGLSNLYFTIEVESKERRYKYTLKDFQHQLRYSSNVPHGDYNKYKLKEVIDGTVMFKKNGNIKPAKAEYREQIVRQIEDLISSLNNSISDGNKDDNW